jgi:hypothetical protein
MRFSNLTRRLLLANLTVGFLSAAQGSIPRYGLDILLVPIKSDLVSQSHTLVFFSTNQGPRQIRGESDGESYMQTCFHSSIVATTFGIVVLIVAVLLKEVPMFRFLPLAVNGL